MTRICVKCYRYWVSLSVEVTEILDTCPTCRAGMKPLSRLVGGPKGGPGWRTSLDPRA